MYLEAIFFFSFWGERSCSSSSNAKSQMVCYPNLKQWTDGNNDKQCCVNVFPDRWKNTLIKGRERIVRSVYKAQKNKIASKPPTVATKNKIITTLLTLSLTWRFQYQNNQYNIDIENYFATYGFYVTRMLRKSN